MGTTENETNERFGRLGEDRKDSIKEELAGERNFSLKPANSDSSIGIENQEDLDSDTINCGWLLTTIICLMSLGTVIGLLIGFIKFSRSKDSWNIYIQVLYAIGSRTAIVVAVSAVVARLE